MPALRDPIRSSVSGEPTLQITPAGATPDARLVDPNAPTVMPVRPGDPTRTAGRPPRVDDNPMPAKIGRFTVLRELGRGGTGIVYAAFDEQLDRKIAVKLLHSETREDVARARLLREAQAMARLSHPNIVGVHEVGTHGKQVYVAMEFVRGMTLHAWLKRQRRSFAEIVAMFVQAGQGLSAAHEAGLVHRDFKPANVMVGADGRARVLDFGLARAEAEPGHSPGLGDMAPAEANASAVANLRSLDASITVTGVMLGTPAYMSPEQFLGGRIDARADQFAFCVALFEAVYRERPFAGDTLAELMSTVLAGQIRDVPTPPGVPRGLRALLVRGLKKEPEERWPSMRALLAELQRYARPVTRRTWTIAAGIAAVLAGGGVGMAYQTGAMDQACSGAEARLAAVWSPETKERLREIARGSGVPQTEAALLKAAEAFDGYGAAWARAYETACREAAGAQLDLRMACLGERRGALSAAVELFERPDEQLVARVGELTASLPRIDVCADDRYLGAKVRPPEDPEVAAQVAALRGELKRAEALEIGGRFAEALAVLDAAEAAAPAGYLPLKAELALRRGSVREHDGSYHGAREALEEAFFLGVEAGHDEVAIDAATRLGYVVGRRLADFHASREWLEHAAIYAERHGDPVRIARALTSRGAIANFTGEHAEARAALSRAVQLYHQAGAEDTIDFARALRFYGDHLGGSGSFTEAIATEERALAIMRDKLGPEHPETAMIYNSLGLVLQRGRQYERALAVFREALDAAVDIDHQRNHAYMTLWANTAFTYEAMGRFDLAEEPMRKAIEVLERSSERLLSDTFELRNYHAGILEEIGRTDEAVAELEALLARAERAWGTSDPRLAQALNGLAAHALHAGDLDAAVAYAERAISLTRDDPRPTSSRFHFAAKWHLAQALARRGEVERALALAWDVRGFVTHKPGKDEQHWIAEIDAFLSKHIAREGT